MSGDAPSIAEVRSLIRTILEQDDFSGRDALLAQVDQAQYVDGPVTMVQLHVDRSLPPAVDAPSPVPTRTSVVSGAGEMIGTLVLWLTSDGYLDCLEYGWVTDEMPNQLPAENQLVKWI